VTGGAGGVGRTLVGVTALSLLDIGLQLVSRRIYLPWSDKPWQMTADSRLLVVGALVVAVAVWNERASARRA
jgi:ribose/xylose/arabinose/galactoside ABC-type transport system permease subunit